MYGTIARMRVKLGQLDNLLDWGNNQPRANPDRGLVGMYVFQMDNNPNELYMVVITESEEAYRAEAESPEAHERFLGMMQFLEAEPEWHDGHVLYNET